MANQDMSEIIERLERLENVVFGKGSFKPKQEVKESIPAKINFSLNERAFVKRYAADKSGPKKFALMVAYLTKGKVGENISLNNIREHWNRMKTKTLLGKFNLFYPNEAKTRGWVDVGGYGIYKLTEEWEQVL